MILRERGARTTAAGGFIPRDSAQLGRLRRSQGRVGLLALTLLGLAGTVAPAASTWFLDPSAMPSFVRRDRGLKSVLVQPDGRLLVSGGFAVAGDTPRTYVARLLPDGRADRSFDPHPVAAPANGGAGVAVHAHGGVLLWGNFGTSDNPEPAQQIVRLLADGTPDRTFQVDPSLTFHDLDELVTTLDGAVMVGGQFSVPARQFQRTWVRLAPNGRLEHLFDPATGPWFTPQPDGRVIQWGPASLTNDLWYYHLSRALPNGEPDGSFTAALQDHLATGTEITTVAPLKDGRLAVGLVETNGHGEVVRLLADGQVDSTFHTSLTGQVDRIAELLALQRHFPLAPHAEVH